MTTVMAPSRAIYVSHPRRVNRQAQQLTGRPYLSHSQLSTFRHCPRKFAFLYIEKATPDFQASSLLFGSAMHGAFESHYRGLLDGTRSSGSSALPSLIETFTQSWRKEVDRLQGVPVRFNKNEDLSSIQAQGQRMLEAFLNSPIASPEGLILGIEESFQLMIDPDLPDILARVDLVAQTPGSLQVVDLKTSRSPWSPQRAEEAASQLLLYGRTLQDMSQELGLPVELTFAVLTKAKKPVMQMLTVVSDEARLAAVREQVSQVWQAIQRGSDFANPSAMNCSLCAFRSRCPAMSRTAMNTL